MCVRQWSLYQRDIGTTTKMRKRVRHLNTFEDLAASPDFQSN